MNLDQWMSEVERAFKEYDKTLSTKIRELLLSKLPEPRSEEQKIILSEVIDILKKYFFQKVMLGRSFGDLNRIEQKFGKTLEQNYGIDSGPFLDLAKVYWTFKIESQDLNPIYTNLTITQVLFGIEFEIGSEFFPTPGPSTVPNSLRKMNQKYSLHKYAPEFDVKRYFAENPYFASGSSQRGVGCLGIIALYALLPILIFILIWILIL